MFKLLNWNYSLGTKHLRGELKFPNGYGVSVLSDIKDSSNLYELAVTRRDGSIDYTTPITNFIETHLTEQKVSALMLRVAELPPG